MNLLTPEQTAQLASNGLTPEADHKPVVYLETHFQGQAIDGFMLSHIEPISGKEACGLMDLGNSVARMGMVFLDQLKTWPDQYGYDIKAKPDVEAT